MQEIDRDLVRWERRKWAAVVFTIFVVHVALLAGVSQKLAPARAVYLPEPKIAFLESGTQLHAQWIALENPFLFASASQNNSSDEAWLRPPNRTLPEVGRRVSPRFLQFAEARKIRSHEETERPFGFLPPLRPVASLPQALKPPRPRGSELQIEGFQNRELAAPFPLPVQYHSDVISSSVVEAMLDRDGLVISARVIQNSGSPKADADALALARRARFSPARRGTKQPDVGKLIFHWFALDLSHTNNVKR